MIKKNGWIVGKRMRNGFGKYGYAKRIFDDGPYSKPTADKVVVSWDDGGFDIVPIDEARTMVNRAEQE